MPSTSRFQSIPATTRVSAPGAARLLPGSATLPRVLLIHGYTGLAADWDFVATALNRQGLTVRVMRLPGHGTNAGDFAATGRGDWLRAAIDEYVDLAGSGAPVFVGGLSMGGLLAVHLAAHFPVAKLVLAAPAIALSNPAVAFTPIARFFVRSVARADYDPQAETDPDLRLLAREYWSAQYLPNVAELYHLQRRARRFLPKVTCDTLTIVSRNDRTVPLKAAAVIAARIGAATKPLLTLEESGHIVVNDVERETVADAIVTFLRPLVFKP